MNRERWLLVIIALSLVIVLLAYLLITSHQEAARPRLQEVRVVSATSDDPVFRDGPRQVGPGTEVTLAVVMRLQELDRSYWMAPVARVELDGQPLELEVVADDWPEQDRYARVFWFTLESAYLNGRLTSATGLEELSYKAFLVPDMGHDLSTRAIVGAMNDDFLGRPEQVELIPGGTLRFYARVEIASTSRRVKPLQTVSSVDQLLDQALPVIRRSADVPPPLSPVVGELLLLPAFTAVPEAEGEPAEELMQRLQELVDLRLIATSESFASLAVSGRARLAGDQLRSLGTLILADDGVLRRQHKTLHWQQEIGTGDLLRTGDHWLVLLRDDGNGLLDDQDQVLHCWREPAVRATLAGALKPAETDFELLRHEPTGP
jgi:hypothetical protein